jgi:hypothetical protein
MRLARKTRNISATEIYWAAQVFDDSLPSWGNILITDALGPIPGMDRPFTVEELPGRLYTVNVGPEYYPDLNRSNNFGFSPCRDLLIHELTHVWQYYHGCWVVPRSVWANKFGKGYEYTLEDSDAWDDFNVEQQASIVENWFNNGTMSHTDERYPFIEKIIRPGIRGGAWANMLERTLFQLPLSELRSFNP